MCITLEGWVDTMYIGRDVTNFIYLNDMFFILLVIVGSFILINLVIAVLYTNFSSAFEHEKEEHGEFLGHPEEVANFQPAKPGHHARSFTVKFYHVRVVLYKIV